ncbi:hypothetical protein CTI12_AA049180 [Artemisia annua]|uniref:ER membrane protein complex subunit 10 n=1 Tax=Artemisia annua TaxID=35608 RepID=A0A2U1NWV2_ARTAN|nr:hypothetical protein CTI12_AA049180 [Artemisia annua]
MKLTNSLLLLLITLITISSSISPSSSFQSDELIADDEEFGLEGGRDVIPPPQIQSPPPKASRKRSSDSESDSRLQFALEHAIGENDEFTHAGTFTARLKTSAHGGQVEVQWRRVTVVQVTRFSGFVRNLMVITVVSEVRPHSPEKWLDLAFLRRTVEVTRRYLSLFAIDNYAEDADTLTKLRFSRNDLTATEKENFKKLLENDDYYKIRLPSDVLNAPGRDYVISSVKARCLARDGLDEHIVIHMEGGNILAVNYGSLGACQYPRQLRNPSKWSFNSHTVLKYSEMAPRTPTFSEEIGSADIGDEEGIKPIVERSFWAKYWMYLVPLGLIVMNAMTQAMNMPEEQASGQAGAQPQQAVGAAPRGQGAAIFMTQITNVTLFRMPLNPAALASARNSSSVRTFPPGVCVIINASIWVVTFTEGRAFDKKGQLF